MTKTARKVGRKDTIACLSFVKDFKKGRCFWNVKATGDYGADCRTGNRLGLEYLAFEERDHDGPGHLQHIVMDMPRKLTGIEIGFLTMVSYAAGAGANTAREVSDYWDSRAKAS
jgi:hypothetical protein